MELGHITPDCSKRKSFIQKVAVAIESRAELGGGKCEGLHCEGSEFNNASKVYKSKSRLQVDHDVIQSIGTCLFPEARVPTATGTANSQTVTVLRDTRCTGVVVKRSLVRENQMLGWESPCMLLNQTIDRVPVAKIEIETPFLTGITEAMCMENPIYDLTIGNVDGSRLPTLSDFRFPIVQAVETRAQTDKKPLLKLKVPEAVTDISRDEFTREQIRNGSLSTERSLSGTAKYCKGGGSSKFVRTKGLMYREFSPWDGGKYLQLVVPQIYRSHVLRLAHESSMAVLREFYWPGVNGDVKRFCRSCNVCQKTVSKGRNTRVPLGKMPLIDTPFKRVAIDIVGPILPITDRKNRYILTLVDYATRYPEAIALPSIETERVAEALVDMFSMVGVPEEILTDCGAQFTSELMSEISRLLSIKQLRTTPYHPMCNGLVERFNGTLKQMLRRMCAEKPRDWD
ncbi:hypothetical protein ACJMK2_043633 [Sinanodonta woodiana]|uniref:Integrase catalytic domain-containing protein n=1 Tax=Sinanodonta woodiana TaxID=1069815 RepID=A0ABD3VY15_SINWO